jgi:integrase
LISAAEQEHYLFPSQIKNKVDATKHAQSWRSAWRSIRQKAARNDDDEVIYPGLERVRFHDLRHTAVTVLAEKGLPDQVIMAQVGHISREMLQHYSHIRRQALNAAAAALEPSFLKPTTQTVELVN